MTNLKFQISNCRSDNLESAIRDSAMCRLLPTFHRGKVVVHGAIGLKAPDRALFFPFPGENRFQERSDLLPCGFGLSGAKPSRHGVVQETVRRVGINTNVEALLCRGQYREHAHDIVAMYEVVEFAEYSG